MPNDPLLYPGMPGPVQSVMTRQGNLEARLAALERKRDLVVTPFSINIASPADIPYYGGRLWLFVGGSASWTTPPTAGTYDLGAVLQLNGVAVMGLSARSYASGTNVAITHALPLRSIQRTPTDLRSTYGLDPGENMNLSMITSGAAGGAGSALLEGLVIEAAQA
jgi:hypothetical protein